MDAGRKLDALIAEKVMGLTYDRSQAEMYGQYYTNVLNQTEVKKYSTDIKAAWEVVEEMAILSEEQSGFGGNDFYFDGPTYKNSASYLTNEGYPTGTTCWYVQFGNRDFRKIVAADTAPHAICLAALKAKGIEV